jgi:Tol biopolymer transport system component
MKSVMIYIVLIAMLLVTGMSPATAQSSCSSGGTGAPVELTLPNLSDRRANLFWIDTNCVEVPYGAAAPGEILKQGTFDGHDWVLRDDSGQVMLQFKASSSVTTILIGANNYQPVPITSACSSAATSQPMDLTVINNTDKPVLVNLILYNCTEQTFAIVPGKNQHIEPSVIGHDWVVRLNDGKVGKQITVSATDNVVIIDPPPSAAVTPVPGNQANTGIGNSTIASPRIVFTRTEGNVTHIYSMNPDGSDIVQITQQGTSNDFPSTSTDGRRIVFESNRDQQNPDFFDIFVMNADGTNVQRLVFNDGGSWTANMSPDDSRIVFMGQHLDATNNWISDIGIMNVGDTNIQWLTNDSILESYPRFSPDGRRLVFVSDADGDTEIYTMNVDGSDVRQLTSNTTGDGNASYTPDGNHILFTSDRGGDNEIYTMNVDGSDVRQLTDDTFRGAAAKPAPDGRIVYVRINADDPNDFGTIYVMNADGSNPTALTNGHRPVWLFPGG